ncbi:putative F-box domain, FBD domain, leucine-rich repeat domain, L domain-containing protein [Medicago truncatula]|uniref:F-box/RNI/FBD-like domain protein n=1 Tax=Medicago truncatula TaxID=3880 RepID=A0A072TR07_MEDTR|nr:FBD-associated F-box protein At4g10400-like [Medicago truncatula]KEH19827.1 F-box/RNI/FBD-like domain protein [Medicago truncatula]RHN41114.1 putative F-box domain, FBD domain, leucine-rich repeat domain, L domain-containing protein [Medicago truncatula]
MAPPTTDRLSPLPDPLLFHILSFLPTRTSVATTSLISRRWRNLWQNLQAFEFSDDSYEDGNWPIMFRRFAFFVNAVLSLRRSRDIKRFRLTSGMVDDDWFRSDCFDVWVRAAIGPQLEELFVSLEYCDEDRQVLVPSSLLNCTNLVSLSLVGAIHIMFQPSSIHLPSLKMLKLGAGVVEFDIGNTVEFNNIDTVDSLLVFLSGCPVLETLDRVFCASFLANVPMSPFFKRLKLTGVNFSWTCVQIDSDWLCVDDSRTTGKTTLGIIGNLQSVEEAYFDVFSLRGREFMDPVLRHLRDNGDIHLLMRHFTSKWPLRTPVLNYPEFCNLHHLKFILPCFNMSLLLNVLEKCHMLQVLLIQSSKEEPSLLRTWEPKSTTVPKCFKSHLTFIHIEGYQGFEDELAFAEYVLQNGLVLHTMLVFFDTSMDLTNKNCSIRRLTDIPRGSVTCQLKFDSAVSP